MWISDSVVTRDRPKVDKEIFLANRLPFSSTIIIPKTGFQVIVPKET